MADATMKQIKDYFGYTDNKQLMADWSALSEAEKAWFKAEVGAICS